jgi:beta-mannanase
MLLVTGVDLRDDVRLIKKYANFVLLKFVPKSTLRKSLITIKVIHHDELTDVKEQKELKEVSAWMMYDGIIDDRKKFTVTLDKAVVKTTAKKRITRYKELLKYLGHELVHTKQYLMNEMFDYKDGQTVRFRGGHYTNSEELDWAYWDSPWEIEAYGRMEGLYQMFLKMTKEERKA